ncbi:hypothetical protein [Luethyella okanaganae]|uniref:Uncharacterized protein n=1 Tax=Luethyella okanaganae TaxID=69372 RepID=A0ABW1VI25_9MICO
MPKAKGRRMPCAASPSAASPISDLFAELGLERPEALRRALFALAVVQGLQQLSAVPPNLEADDAQITATALVMTTEGLSG